MSYEMREEAIRVIGEDRVPEDVLANIVTDYGGEPPEDEEPEADTPNQRRRNRLEKIAERAMEIYDERTREALEAGPVPRYVLVTSEGSPDSTYASNPNITAHPTLAAVRQAAEGEMAGGWNIREITDLDTGEEVGWVERVEISGEDHGPFPTLEILKAECEYHECPAESGRPEEEWETLGSTDSLASYKDALEDHFSAAITLLEGIHELLDGKEWDGGTTADVAGLLNRAGFTVREPEEVDEDE